jgi:hypothetical protein
MNDSEDRSDQFRTVGVLLQDHELAVQHPEVFNGFGQEFADQIIHEDSLAQSGGALAAVAASETLTSIVRTICFILVEN